MNVPKLRFKEFKNEWSTIELSKISSEISYGMGLPSKEYDGINKYIRITDIDENTSKYTNKDIVSPDGKLEDKYIVKKNDILFARTGASTGKTYLYDKKDGKLYYAGFLIKANIINHDANFIFQQTHTSKYNKWIKVMSMRSGQPGINSQEYGSYKFSITSKTEEYKISKTLQLLDKKIELQTKKIEDLKLFKKGLLQKQYNYIKDKNLVELSYIANIYQPQTISQNKLDNGKYFVFGANGIIGKYSRYNHKQKQITISCRGENSGKVNITPEKCWITGNSMVLNTDNNYNVDKIYLKCVLDSQNLRYLISGSGQPQITRNVILKHKIPLLPILEQKKFRNPFIKLDLKIHLEETKVNKLLDIKKGLMQDMFV